MNDKIQLIQDPNIRDVLSYFAELLKEKDNTINLLQNKVADLQNRVTQQEIYTSKDCLIIQNMPISGDGNVPLTHQVCDFLANYIGHKTNPSNFKACHFLGKWENSATPPAVIVKFIYFGEKDQIYGMKSRLANKLNPINRRKIIIKERLPTAQRVIQKHAEDCDLVTTTNKCQVKVFENVQGKFKSIIVKSVEDVDKVQHRAVKRQKRFSNTFPSVSTPKPAEGEYRGLLKRLRNSPNEDEGMKVLKDFYQDPKRTKSVIQSEETMKNDCEINTRAESGE